MRQVGYAFCSQVYVRNLQLVFMSLVMSLVSFLFYVTYGQIIERKILTPVINLYGQICESWIYLFMYFCDSLTLPGVAHKYKFCIHHGAISVLPLAMVVYSQRSLHSFEMPVLPWGITLAFLARSQGLLFFFLFFF